MGFEIPVDVDYFDHPKTKQLMADVGAEADIYPLRLWKWAAAYCKRGDLGPDPRYIEHTMGWEGKGKTRGRLLLALVRWGFLDLSMPEKGLIPAREAEGMTREYLNSGSFLSNPGSYQIHDWMEHIGRAVCIYDAKKRKMREEYARKKGILPEETGKTSTYPGGDNREGRRNPVQDTQEGRRGDSRPPAPPQQGAPGDAPAQNAVATAAEPQGDVIPFPARTGGEQDVDPFDLDLEAFSAFRTPGPRHKREAFEDLVRQGVSHDRIREAAREHADWDFYEVVKALRNGRGKQGQGRPNPPPRPAAPPISETQRKLDEARAAADQKLAELPAEERASWTRDAEAQAEQQKIPEAMRKTFVTTILRVRAARAFGIEGV
jgi:hypothetical protein